MCEGDYGVTLPVEITGTEFTAWKTCYSKQRKPRLATAFAQE